jgi:hypothetical protein
MAKKKKHMKTAAVQVKFQFRGKRFEIILVVPPDMESRLYGRLRKRLKKA